MRLSWSSASTLRLLALTGVRLEDLLNPSKVVNYERERLSSSMSRSRRVPM